MTLEATNWEVLVVGYWNRAILTPRGVASMLFKLPEGAGIEIMVPVEGLESAQVKHEGIIVKVDDRRLIIGMEEAKYENLQKAMELGRNALTELPRTPFLAAGFNIRFKVPDSEFDVDEFIKTTSDTRLFEADYKISVYRWKRQIPLSDGLVNLSVAVDDSSEVTIEFNFHRGSKKQEDLVSWLSLPREEIAQNVNKILSAIRSPLFEEENNAPN